MRTSEMAEAYLFRAKRCLLEARQALKDEDYAGTVRRSQEALELSLKAVLRCLAIEYPKSHDVGKAFAEVKDRLPDYLKEKAPSARRLSSELARLRGPAFYGFEREGIPPTKAIKPAYAKNVFAEVDDIVKLCAKYLEEWFSSKSKPHEA